MPQIIEQLLVYGLDKKIDDKLKAFVTHDMLKQGLENKLP